MRLTSTSLAFLSMILSFGQNYYFPPTGGNWDTLSPSTLNWCKPKIDSLYSYLDNEQTKSFIVLKNGKIVLEKYFNGHNATTNWVWYSAGKSLRAMLIGIAQSEGLLSIGDKTTQYLGSNWSSLPSNQEDSISISHHLSMTTGLNEQYFSCTDDSCLTYKAPVGSRWFYHNAAYNLTKDILEAATNKNHNIYTLQKIANPIGMNSGTWIKTGYNDFFFSRARDMARFGILVANKGKWNGNTILNDTSYFNQMVNSSQSINPSYGYLWWLNGKNSIIAPGDSISYPVSLAQDAPNDVILAAGAQGQYISISNSNGLIMIRQGLANNPSLTGDILHNEIWKRIMNLECSSINIQENELEIESFPNPAKNEIQINNGKGATLYLINSNGVIVLEKNIDSNQEYIDVNSVMNGLYVLKIEKDLKSTFKKILIERN